MQHKSWRDKNTKPDEIKGDSHGVKACLYPDKPVNLAVAALPERRRSNWVANNLQGVFRIPADILAQLKLYSRMTK